MSSENVLESHGVPLEVCGMSSRFRTKWNIPIESFEKQNTEAYGVLDSCSLQSIEQLKNNALSLDLLKLGNCDYACFSLRITGDKVLGQCPVLEHAFVFLKGEPHFLVRPSNEIFWRFPSLKDETIREMRSAGATEVKIITVHCAIFIGVAGIALKPKDDGNLNEIATKNNSSECCSLPDFDNYSFEYIKTYFFEGNIPPITVDNAEDVLTGIRDFKLNELRPFVTMKLKSLISKETALKITRIAIDNRLYDLQKASITYMERHCKPRFK